MFINQSHYDTISVNQAGRQVFGKLLGVSLVLIIFIMGIYFGILNNNLFDILSLIVYLLAGGTGLYFIWLSKYTHKQFHSEYPSTSPKEWILAPYLPVTFPMIKGEAIIIDNYQMYYKSNAFIAHFLSKIMQIMITIAFTTIVGPLLIISLVNDQFEVFFYLVGFFSALYIVLYLILLYPSYMLSRKSISWTFKWKNTEEIVTTIKNPRKKELRKVLSKKILKQLEINEITKEDTFQIMRDNYQYTGQNQANKIFYKLEFSLDQEQTNYILLITDNKEELLDFKQCYLQWLGA